VATLIFQPPEALDPAETVTLSYSSNTLLLMGYGPEDSEDSIVYNIENGLLTVEQRLSAAELAEGLPLIPCIQPSRSRFLFRCNGAQINNRKNMY
jgi:hypothetical protein